MSSRRATHAGSWYSNSERELSGQLENWLGLADHSHAPARAIISPHAGYQYCGACAAFAYRQISPAMVRRIFILGPSHHVRLNGCALSTASKYKTPIYDLNIDKQVYSELQATNLFEWMSMGTDEDEHSIEMQLPYIAKVMEDYKDKFTIIPIMVGSIGPDKESVYGKVLSKYLADPECLFIISSDFCHWGSRFRYTYYDKSSGDIYQSIQNLDKHGMDIIESLDPHEFTHYLKKFNNTICGRHPIGILLNMASHLNNKGSQMRFKFLRYAQSSRCYKMDDSSVSYAAGSLIME